MSTSTGFDPFNMYLKTLSSTQEMFQLATKMWSNTQKVQQSQQSIEQLWQEYMNCISDTVAMGMSIQQVVGKAKNPEDSMKAAEKVILEYGEKNLVHSKNFLNILHNVWQEAYNYTKDNTTDFTEKCTEAAADITKKITENVNKFAETASNAYCATTKTNNSGNVKKQHHNVTEGSN